MAFSSPTVKPHPGTQLDVLSKLKQLHPLAIFGASSHAANTFAVATYCWLIFRPIYRWIAILFLWAAVMTYSRIYLGVHYPTDVLVGGGLGVLFGLLCYRLQRFYIRRREEKSKSAGLL